MFTVDEINRFFREQDEMIQKALPLAEEVALAKGIRAESIEKIKQAAKRTRVSNTWFATKVLHLAMSSDFLPAEYIIEQIVKSADPVVRMQMIEEVVLLCKRSTVVKI